MANFRRAIAYLYVLPIYSKVPNDNKNRIYLYRIEVPPEERSMRRKKTKPDLLLLLFVLIGLGVFVSGYALDMSGQTARQQWSSPAK